jgi:NAD(P)H-hydrate epimerase
MEHASRGVAALAAALVGSSGAVLALCGPGNNGGDGYGAARFLRSWGFEVAVLRASPREPSGGDAGLQYALAAAAGPVVDAWSNPGAVHAGLDGRPALVIDALFGVGLTRPLEAPFRGWIEATNAAGIPILAVDVPSGMDSDSGEPLPVCVAADVTATMAAPKLGLAVNPAAAGRVVEVDIGLPRSLHAAYLATAAGA